MKRYEKLERDPAAREQAILKRWADEGTFEKSLEKTRGGTPYVFYEGPPTANGMPHFGHLMPRVYKDLFPRYKTMRGYYVARKGGWDTHGLPVELEVEKLIGVDSKPEIEAYGVERFVEKCKESVWKYKAEWERMIERMGFWIDLENAYVTYTDDYIESVWWELKTMFDRGLLYQGHKTLPYCPRCGTGLSSHEVAQGYREVSDPSVFIRMRVISDEGAAVSFESPESTSLLAWTTTPWTLPGNVALAVASEATYVEVETGEERMILAKDLVGKALRMDATVLREIPGADLVGLRYEPPYRLTDDDAAYRVYAAGFVNLEDGTGLVHVASAFGEDDYQLGQEVGLPFVQPVGLDGRFTEEFPFCAGEVVKEADPKIIADLTDRGILFRHEPYEHDYPFCWRCDTPLLYYAMDSWYVQTTAVKDQMIANNRTIHWYPAHVGEGRLGSFLENLKDWALSRDRYWGTPLNLWVCETCGEIASVGSREELVSRALDPQATASVELHRPYIDGVTLRCSCGGTARRVPYVIDTWFDSGSMHTAQWHHPFENEERFRESFPADFICEAMEQTRGWFYTLLATSTILYGVAPYRNCVGTGLGLDEAGLKMSKSKGNVVNPWEYIDRYGADCVRWYLYSSSAPWKSKRLGEAAVQEPLYRFLDTIRNTYDFFALYASIDGYDPVEHLADDAERSTMDRWILSRLQATIGSVSEALDAYDVLGATGALESLVDEVSNWYVRLSRRRFWRGGMESNKVAAYETLRAVLIDLAKLLAPFVPFLAEAVYLPLRAPNDPESVHLCAFPTASSDLRDERLEREMDVARRVAALGHQARNQAEIKVRQPLASIVLESPTGRLSDPVVDLLRRELNLESVDVVDRLSDRLTETPVPNFRSLGPRLGPLGQPVGEWIKAQSGEGLKSALAEGSVSVEVGGRSVEVLSEDVQFVAGLPDGFVQAGEGKEQVLLDVRIDERLRAQGLTREVVHRIQLARKDAGFDVTDRIAMTYRGDDVLCRVVAENADEIADEILAVRLESGNEETSEYRQTIELEEGSLTIGLARV